MAKLIRNLPRRGQVTVLQGPPFDTVVARSSAGKASDAALSVPE
eukprot:CAMPEP_0172734024 /NCGR_PEP_ID=MMETSP1074-20121228/108853_1 /TAXON_ID=2916 /ORGANISM="Ceratium fusus, Strain PA161109" /LENGTH=43 /DNA_ID= /DNA_START= /DNA_END= /DNA_ORIENTATION=